MAAPGPKPKPHLQVVREGNPGHRAVKEGAKFVPGELIEPDWNNFFPSVKRGPDRNPEMLKAQKTASSMWNRLALQLQRAAGLSEAQSQTLLEYCLTVARIEQCERALSIDGLYMTTERGYVKHPLSTTVNAYRAHFRSLTGELGLSPSAAARLTGATDDDDDDSGLD